MQEKSNRQNWLLLLGWVVFFQFMAGLSSLVSGKSSWYMGLLKSSWTPPGYVFGVVWTILYILLAVYAWSVITETVCFTDAGELQLVAHFFRIATSDSGSAPYRGDDSSHSNHPGEKYSASGFVGILVDSIFAVAGICSVSDSGHCVVERLDL